YDREVKVTGITSDGKKVTLPNRTYNLFYADYVKYDENTGKLRVVFESEGALKSKFDDKSELSFTLRVVTEGGKGLTATQNVVTSKNTPGPNSIEIKDNDDKVITSAKFGAGKVNLGEISNKFKIIIKDQYGVEA